MQVGEESPSHQCVARSYILCYTRLLTLHKGHHICGNVEGGEYSGWWSKLTVTKTCGLLKGYKFGNKSPCVLSSAQLLLSFDTSRMEYSQTADEACEQLLEAINDSFVPSLSNFNHNVSLLLYLQYFVSTSDIHH